VAVSVKTRLPVRPLRSGRFPKVIEIPMRPRSGLTQRAKTLTPNRLILGGDVVVVLPGRVVVVVVVDGAVDEVVVLVVVDELVVGADVVVDDDEGLVDEDEDVVVPSDVDGGIVVDVEVAVLEVGATVVVVAAVAVVVGATVVVGGVGVGHESAPGSGWPTSKAIATERPWPSLKKAPIAMKFFNARRSTEIGF
jgi:hypothetical protein